MPLGYVRGGARSNGRFPPGRKPAILARMGLFSSSARSSVPPTAVRLVADVAVAAALVAVVFALCTRVGPLVIDGGRWWSDPVWTLRALRLAAAAIAGAGLAVAGAAIQGLLRNPLGDPYVLGIASGAGVGVRAGLALGAWAGWIAWRLPVFAFAGALGAAASVYAVARRRGRVDPFSLILAGVIVNILNGALIMALYLATDPLRVDEFARWAMGELPEAVDPALLAVCGGLTLAAWAAVFRRAGALNALGLGDDVARSLGVPVGALRVEIFVASALATAGAVALAGPVSFVGLMVPHVCRFAAGPDHRRLLLLSGFGGAILMMAAETLCRGLGPHLGAGRLPVGLLTALLGAPFFIALLRRRFAEEDA